MTYKEALKELKHEIDMLPKEPPSDFVVNENVWLKIGVNNMSEYIKKQEALQAKNEFLNTCVKKDTNEETEYARAYAKGWNDCNSSFIDNIESIKVADVQEVHHGKWIQFKEMRRDDGEIYDYCCSRCCGLAGKDDYGNHTILSAYCPHCGAKMDSQ